MYLSAWRPAAFEQDTFSAPNDTCSVGRLVPGPSSDGARRDERSDAIGRRGRL